MKIIAFTGMPCSGKSEAVQLAKDKGMSVIRMGDLIWEETRRQGKELTDKNVGEVADSMREKYGKDIWARKTVEKIKTLDKTDCIIIDGIRNSEEIDTFKKELGKEFMLIAITASPEVRQKRVMSRGRKDDSKYTKDFKERDKRELHWGLGAIITAADIIVENEGNLDEFRYTITKILTRITDIKKR